MSNQIRNFCIIAHIDHGKSTLADRFLEMTGTIEKRKMKEQILDQMDLERERGITIKLQPARMEYRSHTTDTTYILNLIDTPGHVDFTYEVSRSLAAVEGAILLVDATQGVQAQTLANLYLALEQNLTIVPVVNKIDLPNAEIDRTKKEISNLLGCEVKSILAVSGKTGKGVEALLQRLVVVVPPPIDSPNASLQALIFDSTYDDYRGVIAYVRVVSGTVRPGDQMYMVGTGKASTVLSVGYFKPSMVDTNVLSAGEIGYIVTGLKSVMGCRVGDTVIHARDESKKAALALPGYRQVNPMVYAGIFPRSGDEYPRLRDAIERLKLNDAALTYTSESSPVLGFGFRCGFLGLLHLEIFQERLRREFGVVAVVTTPSVSYHVVLRGSGDAEGPLVVHSPQDLPDPTRVERIEEPIVALDIIARGQDVGSIMDLLAKYRGVYTATEYLDEDRPLLHYEVPLQSILVDFYDKLKGASSGYASMNYQLKKFRAADVVKMDILIAEEVVGALSSIVYRDEAETVGRKVVETLKATLPRQQFEVKIQAAIGGKIIAAERLSALRKDVTAKLYGGDVTRKRKLLEKQKKGKKKMMARGKVEIPPSAYMAVLKR